MPGTATTSSPRTTSGHASRSERGTFASTNTSWIFRLLPASRSPGLCRRTSGGEPVEDRLHLIGGVVAGGSEPVAGDGPPLVAKGSFREFAAVEFHDLRAERLSAEARILLGVDATQLVVHVERRDAIAERVEHVPQAGRVGAARDEARRLGAGRDALMLA